ncbi:proline-rich domain-containing protein [Actinomadura rayongensis]|uniref:Type IV secretion system protein n=1 Tax=Actinomadura rayongensis TaxID=1429076 RepID=A0A6I4W7Q0_9ACTN|nr:proline-rich domain-containing protein [Actinomadura rayongensis]MXQ65638.1 hypothetical protein [Actinomadura rayongensis]
MSPLAVPLVVASLALGPSGPATTPTPSAVQTTTAPTATPSTAPSAPSAQPSKATPTKPAACVGKAKDMALCKNSKTDDGGGGGSWFSISGWAKKAFGAIAKSFGDAAIDTVKWTTSWWIAVDSPQLSASPDSPVGFLRTHTRWLTGFGVVLGLLLAAGRTAWERRGEPLRDALAGLIRLVVVSGCSVVVANLVIEAGDAYSTAVWNAGADGTDLSGAGAALFGAGAAQALTNPAVMIVLGLLVLLSSLVQFAMLMLRSIMLVVLVGLLPVAASASVTPEGHAWLRRMLGWFVAFGLFQPVAATLYAVSFMWMKSGNGLEPLQGFILIIGTVMALPALMRFVAPAVAAASGGGGGGVAALAGAAALGARALPALGRGAGDQGGPTGARQAPGVKDAGDQTGDQPPPKQPKGGDQQPGDQEPEQPPATPPQGLGQTNTAPGAAVGHPAIAAAGLVAEGARFGKQAIQGAVDNATEGGEVASGAKQ